MTKAIILSLFLVAPALALAGEPAPVLSADESQLMCAEALPKHLACKDDFCAAMVKIRTKGDKNVDLKAMTAKCLQEIAVDGTGDLSTRKARCAGWQKERPMSMKRADAKEIDACWAKASCKERIDCWAPKMAKVMEASAPKKK